MIQIVQFSPTGNTAYLAGLLAKHLNVETVHVLENVTPQSLGQSDHIILMYPIHAFNAPKIVRQFAKGLAVISDQAVSLIGVGCNTVWVNDASSSDLKKTLKKKGYKIMVDRVIAMPLTLVTAFPENLVQDQIVEAKLAIEAISTAIMSQEQDNRSISIRARMLRHVGRIESFAARFFGLELHAKKSCTKCGLCVKSCPKKNIQMTDKGRIKFGFKCMLCMRCIYNCPVHAITPRISKFVPIKGGYDINKHIKEV